MFLFFFKLVKSFLINGGIVVYLLFYFLLEIHLFWTEILFFSVFNKYLSKMNFSVEASVTVNVWKIHTNGRTESLTCSERLDLFLNGDLCVFLQRFQTAGHRSRSELRAGRRIQQLQRLPRLQEQPLHLPGAGGQEPHPAPQQRVALLQRPARRHDGDLLWGGFEDGRRCLFRSQFVHPSVFFADLWGDWSEESR